MPPLQRLIPVGGGHAPDRGIDHCCRGHGPLLPTPDPGRRAISPSPLSLLVIEPPTARRLACGSPALTTPRSLGP
jgi:hypothetical protein